MKKLISGLLFCLATVTAQAEIAVVVNPGVSDTLDASTISKIFLGKSKRFPSGASATPVNQNEGNAIVDQFNQQVLKRNSSQVKAYWSKLLFTGKGKPPVQLASDADVLQKVASDASAIGYVDAASVNDTVKVIAKF